MTPRLKLAVLLTIVVVVACTISFMGGWNAFVTWLSEL